MGKLDKKVVLISIVMILVLVLSSCNIGVNDDKKFSTDKPHVVATIYPVYEFAQKVLGDSCEIKLLVPPGTEIHEYEPTTSDIIMLNEADILIQNGAGMESFLDNTLKSIDNKKLYTIDCSANVELLTFEDTTVDGDMLTGKNSEDYKHAAKESVAEDEHNHHEHNSYNVDPHIWLSPLNAIKMTETIQKAFVDYVELKNLSANIIEDIEKRTSRYIKELEELKEQCDECFSTIKVDEIVVSHEAFGYLLNGYGIKQLAIDGVSAGESDARTLSNITAYLKNKNIKVIFYEKTINYDSATVIASESDCTMEALNTIESLSEKECEEGMDYISAMKSNLASLGRLCE